MGDSTIEMMEKLMTRNNTISLAILGAMVTFVVLMFTFIITNSSQHNDIKQELLIEQQYTHNIYKYIIDPNDSIVKVLIIKSDREFDALENRHDSVDMLLDNHDKRINVLERWKKSN